MIIINSTPRNGFSLTELVLVMVFVGVMSSLSLIVFGDQLAKSEHKNNVNKDASWLQSIQNKAVEQNKVCVIKIEKSAQRAVADTSFVAIATTEYCTGISPYKFSATINTLNPDPLSTTCKSDPNDPNTMYIIFPPSGAIPCGGEILFQSEVLRNNDAEFEFRCVNITTPLGVIRQGLQTQETPESCDYTKSF